MLVGERIKQKGEKFQFLLKVIGSKAHKMCILLRIVTVTRAFKAEILRNI